jgi:hypothetical protein
VFETKRGRYFYEVSNKEHYDGAITGTLMKFLPGSTMCKSAGSFRIEGDGTVARAPKFLKDAAKNAKPVTPVLSIGSGGPMFQLI